MPTLLLRVEIHIIELPVTGCALPNCCLLLANSGGFATFIRTTAPTGPADRAAPPLLPELITATHLQTHRLGVNTEQVPGEGSLARTDRDLGLIRHDSRLALGIPKQLYGLRCPLAAASSIRPEM